MVKVKIFHGNYVEIEEELDLIYFKSMQKNARGEIHLGDWHE
jgi:hypothetical protein